VLSYQGAAVAPSQFGDWKPIAMTPMGAGYEVAWRLGSSDQYTAWDTDSSGNMVSMPIGVVSGESFALQSLESSFHQDLNGDGTIGAEARTIESFGGTALVQVADRYALGSASGPQVGYGGAAVTVGQFGAWTAIGAEAISGGYEVAWRLGSSDQYTVWNTDSSGNMVSMPTGVVSGESFALQSLESSFHQDLNGDGTIGPVTTPIESFGSTAIAQVADSYVLSSVGGSPGPLLKFGGTAVTAGQFGAWAPIGAEATADGYEVAWKMGADQYSVWDTDHDGNMLANPAGVISGSSPVLQGLEASFQQDLNGDGLISQATMSLMVQNMAAVGAGGGAETTAVANCILVIDQDVLAHPNG
jgi:serralysin